MMFRTDKTMFRPPGDVSQAARIVGKNNVCWLTSPGGLNIVFSVLNIVQRPQHRFLAKLWHKNDVFDEKKGIWES